MTGRRSCCSGFLGLLLVAITGCGDRGDPPPLPNGAISGRLTYLAVQAAGDTERGWLDIAGTGTLTNGSAPRWTLTGKVAQHRVIDAHDPAVLAHLPDAVLTTVYTAEEIRQVRHEKSLTDAEATALLGVQVTGGQLTQVVTDHDAARRVLVKPIRGALRDDDFNLDYAARGPTIGDGQQLAMAWSFELLRAHGLAMRRSWRFSPWTLASARPGEAAAALPGTVAEPAAGPLRHCRANAGDHDGDDQPAYRLLIDLWCDATGMLSRYRIVDGDTVVVGGQGFALAGVAAAP